MCLRELLDTQVLLSRVGTVDFRGVGKERKRRLKQREAARSPALLSPGPRAKQGMREKRVSENAKPTAPAPHPAPRSQQPPLSLAG